MFDWKALSYFCLACGALANPSSIQNELGASLLPFAGEKFTLEVVGTGLTLADRVRIVDPTVQCGNSGASAGPSHNLASLSTAGSTGTSGFSSTSQQWFNLMTPVVQMWRVCWCGPPRCTEDFDFNVEVGLFSAIGPTIQDAFCYITETCVIQLGGSSFSNMAGLAVMKVQNVCGNADSEFASWNGITNPNLLNGAGDGSAFVMSAFSTSNIIRTEGSKHMCWSVNPVSLTDYVVFVGMFQMYPSGSPIQQRCTLSVLCSILLSGEGFFSTNRLLISSETVCGREGRAEFVGFTNPQQPGNSSDFYTFGAALSGTPGVYKLCWSHNPTSDFDWLFLLNVGEISICGPVDFGTASGTTLLPTLVELFSVETRGVCLSFLNRIRIVSQATQCGSVASFNSSELLSGPVASTPDLEGIPGSTGDGDTSRSWHNISVPQPTALRLCWCPGPDCLQGLDFRIIVGDFVVRGPSLTQITPPSDGFIAGGRFSVELNGSSMEASDRIRVVIGAASCGTEESVMTTALSSESATMLNEASSAGSSGNIATSLRWQSLRLDAAGTFRLCWCGKDCTTNPAFIVDVGTLDIAGPRSSHNVICVATESCSIHLYGTGFSESNALLLVASHACDDPQATIFSWMGIANPQRNPSLDMSNPLHSAVYFMGIASASPFGSIASICWASNSSSNSSALMRADFTVFVGSFVMHGPKSVSEECELGLPCTRILELTGTIAAVSFVRVAPLGGCSSTLDISLVGFSTAQSNGTYALGTAVRGAVGMYDLCWWTAASVGSHMNFGTLSIKGPSRLADGFDSMLRPLRDATFTLEVIGRGIRSDGRVRLVKNDTHCGGTSVSSGTEYLSGSLVDAGHNHSTSGDSEDGGIFTHLSWPNLALSSLGTYRACWCVHLPCEADLAFNVDVGTFVVPAGRMQLDPQPVAGEFFCVSLLSEHLRVTDRLRLVNSSAPCGTAGLSLLGVLDLDSTSPSPSTTTTFSTSSSTVSNEPEAVSKRWCSLKLHYAVEIRGCWCGSPCISPEDYVMDVGVFTIAGPMPLGEIICYPTSPCVVQLAGSGFSASNRIIVVSTSSCGDSGATLGSWRNITNPQSSNAISATSSIFNFGIPVEVPSSSESSGVACWSHAPTNSEDPGEYSVYLGAFSVRGPESTTLECFSGNLCSLQLQGTALGGESIITVVDASNQCATGPSALTSSVPVLLQSSNQSSLIIGAYHFGMAPSDIHGMFQLCWRFRGSIGPSLAIGLVNFVGPRSIAGGTGAAIQAYAGQTFTLEILGSRLAEANRIRIHAADSLTCGASGTSGISRAVTEGSKNLLNADASVGSSGSRQTSVMWTGLSLQLAGSFQVCWCQAGACLQDDDFFSFAGIFSLLGPVEVVTISASSLTESAAMAGIPFRLELRGSGLTSLDSVRIIDGGSSCGSILGALPTNDLAHPLETPTADPSGTWLRWSPFRFEMAKVYWVCWCRATGCATNSNYPIGPDKLVVLGIQPKDVECVVTQICTFQMEGSGLANTNRILVLSSGLCSAGAANAMGWVGLNNPEVVFVGTGTYILGTPTNGTTSSNHPLCWQSEATSAWVRVGSFSMLGPSSSTILSVTCVVGQSCSADLEVTLSLSSGSLLISSTSCGADAVAVNVPGLENPRQSVAKTGETQHYDFGTISEALSSTDSLLYRAHPLCWAALVGTSSRPASEHTWFAGQLEIYAASTTSTSSASLTRLTTTTSTTTTSIITTSTSTSSPSTSSVFHQALETSIETTSEAEPEPSEVRCYSMPYLGGAPVAYESFTPCLGKLVNKECLVECLDGSQAGTFICDVFGRWSGQANCQSVTTTIAATSTRNAIIECSDRLHDSWHRDLVRCDSRRHGNGCEAHCSGGFEGNNATVTCMNGSWFLDGNATACTYVQKYIVVTLTIYNVSYSRLVSNSSLLVSFERVLVHVFADAAGNETEPEHVAIALSSGSVVVQATISPPPTIPAEVVYANLFNLSYSLADTVLLAITALDGFSNITTGEVSISAVDVILVNRPLPSTTIPLSLDENEPEEEGSGSLVFVILAVVLAVIVCASMAFFLSRSSKSARCYSCCTYSDIEAVKVSVRESVSLGCLCSICRSCRQKNGHTKVPADDAQLLGKMDEASLGGSPYSTRDREDAADLKVFQAPPSLPGVKELEPTPDAFKDEPVDDAVKEQALLPAQEPKELQSLLPSQDARELDDVILAALLATVEEEPATPTPGTAGVWDVDEDSDAPPNVPEPADDLLVTDQLDDLFGTFTRKS